MTHPPAVAAAAPALGLLITPGEPEMRDGLAYVEASSVRLLGRAADDPAS